MKPVEWLPSSIFARLDRPKTHKGAPAAHCCLADGRLTKGAISVTLPLNAILASLRVTAKCSSGSFLQANLRFDAGLRWNAALEGDMLIVPSVPIL